MSYAQLTFLSLAVILFFVASTVSAEVYNPLLPLDINLTQSSCLSRAEETRNISIQQAKYIYDTSITHARTIRNGSTAEASSSPQVRSTYREALTQASQIYKEARKTIVADHALHQVQCAEQNN